MSLGQLSKEELKEMALVEIAYEILKEKKQPLAFTELVDQITELLGLSAEEARMRVSQFYTDLNIDGRFINVGDNTWGIKSWYPVEQFDDEIVPAVKSKKRKSKALEDDEFDDIDYDDLDEFDDLDDLDDDEFDDEDEDEDYEDEEEEFIDDELLEDDDLLIDEDLDDDIVDTDLDEED